MHHLPRDKLFFSDIIILRFEINVSVADYIVVQMSCSAGACKFPSAPSRCRCPTATIQVWPSSPALKNSAGRSCSASESSRLDRSSRKRGKCMAPWSRSPWERLCSPRLDMPSRTTRWRTTRAWSARDSRGWSRRGESYLRTGKYKGGYVINSEWNNENNPIIKNEQNECISNVFGWHLLKR